MNILYWLTIASTFASSIFFVQGLCLKLPWVDPEDYHRHFWNMISISVLLLIPPCIHLFTKGPQQVMTLLSVYAIGFTIGLLAEIYRGEKQK